MIRKFYPEKEEELLQNLKKEIIRLGLENSPSRLTLSKLYDRDAIPHPLNYVKYFGTWDSILKRIGLENNRINAAKEPEYKIPKTRWEDKGSEFWLEALIEELCLLGLNENPSRTELMKVYDKNRIPSPNSYMKYLGSWENVLEIIEKDPRIKRKTTRNRRKTTINRLPRGLNNQDPYEVIFPKGPSKQVLINVMIDEMRTKKLYTKKDYQAKYNMNALPDMAVFTRATGLKWKDLWDIYVERLGDPIKQERENYRSDLNLFLLD